MIFVIDYRVEGADHRILKEGSMRVKNVKSRSEALTKLQKHLEQTNECVEVILLDCKEEISHQSGDQTLDYLKSLFRM